MRGIPWMWAPLWGFVAIAFWAFLLWLAWSVVTAVRGMHVELVAIRRILDDRLRGAGGSAP